MRTWFFVLSVALMWNVTDALAEVVRPNDLRVTKPTADVPHACANYSGGWSGQASDGRKLEFWVEKVNPDCSAQVVYVWGPLPGSVVVGEAGFHRTTGQISANGLAWELQKYNARANYLLTSDGTIQGDFRRGRNNYVTVLSRIPH